MATKLETLVSLITSGSTSIYAYEKPKGNNACVVYKLISTNPVRTFSKTAFEQNRVQLDCWGATMTSSRALALKMKTSLDRNMTSFTLSYLINDFTVKDLETGLFVSILDFYIW
jgi:hypothetical protein